MRTTASKLWSLAIPSLCILILTLPVSAGVIPITAISSGLTDAGFFGAGTDLHVTVTGTVNLGPSASTTNPDGSLALPLAPATCAACWLPGYQYFLPGAVYPTAAGGDGINHFPGGGGNYDSFNPQHFAFEGALTTDTTNPNAFRFGAVVGTFTATPTANSADWFLVGTGGDFFVPDGGAHLYLIVVDTFYPNNTGSYSANVTASSPIPEPATAAVAVSGLLLMGLLRKYRSGKRA